MMNSTLSRLATIGVLSLTLSMPAFAYDKKDEQIIKKDIATMVKRMDKGDYTALSMAMPESFIKITAKELGTTPKEFKEKLEMTADFMAHFGVQFKFDTDKIKGYQSKTGRDYAFIPTLAITGDIETASHLLAIKENGKWHYIQYQDPRVIKVIHKAYPDIKKLP